MSRSSCILAANRKEHLKPAYLDVNPQGLVLALVDDDLVLAHTIAIIEYLDKDKSAAAGAGQSA